MRKDKKIKKKKPGMNMPLVIAIMLICAGGGAGAAYYFSKSDKQGTNLPTGKPALGIPVPQLNTEADVKEYMRQQLITPIPRDYKFPDYIVNAPNYDMAMLELNKRYPNFSGKEGTELINAVWRNPMEHQQMTLENKAARVQFNPQLWTDPRYGGRKPGE